MDMKQLIAGPVHVVISREPGGVAGPVQWPTSSSPTPSRWRCSGATCSCRFASCGIWNDRPGG